MMVISLFSSTHLLAAAGFTPPVPALVRRRAVERPSQSEAARAAVHLVDTVLTMGERPEIYRDVLWQLDAVHGKLDRLPEGAAETHHLERILDALPLNGESPTELRFSLAAYEAFLQREARLADALQVLLLGARAYGPMLSVADFAACALRAGRLNRLLARWDHATACFIAAAEAGRVIDDEAVVLRSCLGRGTIYRSQGELTAARATMELVMRKAGRLGLADVQVRAYGELGVVLRLQGALAEGLQAAYYAFQLSLDDDERFQALRDVGLGLADIGAYDESRNALVTVRTSASEREVLLGASALIGLLGVEAAVGDRVAFERWRDEAETVHGRMPPGMAVAHWYKLGLGLARFGQRQRAHAVVDEALRVARANRLRGWCREIEGRQEPVAMAG